jgi:hypothetical protein
MWRCPSVRYDSISGVEVQLNSLLTSILDDMCVWSVTRHGHFTAGKISAGTYYVGCWMDSRLYLDASEKIRIYYSYWDSKAQNVPTITNP